MRQYGSHTVNTTFFEGVKSVAFGSFGLPSGSLSESLLGTCVEKSEAHKGLPEDRSQKVGDFR